MMKGGRSKLYAVNMGRESVLDYDNQHTGVEKDDVISSLLPDVVGTCAIGRSGEPTCMRESTLRKIAQGTSKKIEKSGVNARGAASTASNAKEMRDALVAETGCGCGTETGGGPNASAEKCLLKAAIKNGSLTAAEAGIEEQIAFKQRGPTDVSLFSDAIIHAQIFAWMYQFPSFYAYNFNMLDYATHSLQNGEQVNQPDTLATISWVDIFEGRAPFPNALKRSPAANTMMLAKNKPRAIRTSACVINSDVYSGRGKHWMALFVDARSDDLSVPWTVEFFNSAAQPPESEWVEWQAKTRKELLDIRKRMPGVPSNADNVALVKVVNVCRVWHQHSKTECGPYSLFYTWARLNGTPIEYFMSTAVPDQIVIEFRQHLFADKSSDAAKIGTPFDFAAYAKAISVKWDVENLKENKKRANM